MEPNSRRISWVRVLVEGAVIVASILLAFGIDAWWADREAQVEQQELFRALQSEFAAASDELKRAQEVHVARGNAIDRLIQIMDGDADTPPLDTLWSLMFAAQRPTTIDPPLGVLESALGSGALSQIEDADLRAGLAAWPRHILDNERTEDNVRGYARTVLWPWLAENAEYPPAEGPLEPWRAASERLMRSQAYRGHLWNMNGPTRSAVEENEWLLGEIDRLQRLLSSALR